MNRLLTEPALLAQVKHPCVVGVEDYFTADGKLAIALEFVNGEDLKAILDRGDTFTAEQVRTLLIQLGGALSPPTPSRSSTATSSRPISSWIAPAADCASS